MPQTFASQPLHLDSRVSMRHDRTSLEGRRDKRQTRRKAGTQSLEATVGAQKRAGYAGRAAERTQEGVCHSPMRTCLVGRSAVQYSLSRQLCAGSPCSAPAERASRPAPAIPLPSPTSTSCSSSRMRRMSRGWRSSSWPRAAGSCATPTAPPSRDSPRSSPHKRSRRSSGTPTSRTSSRTR